MSEMLENLSETIFERIKHFNKIGQEYWSARELFKVLEYQKWDKFISQLTTARGGGLIY